MKRLPWQLTLAAGLLLLSALIYWIQALIYHDFYHASFYLIGDIAFIPVQVLLVTLVLERVIRVRERRVIQNKLNMVIGLFFSEVGANLIRRFIALDPRGAMLADRMLVAADWNEQRFAQVRSALQAYEPEVDSAGCDLDEFRGFLGTRAGFLLGLLENPNLLEHERFTDLLWAVFHLNEELACRKTLVTLEAADRKHLEGDIRRAYALLIAEWLRYMEHLKKAYPYLFSLALRTNPFNPKAAAEVK